jgi:hypothetical protein
VQLQRLLRPCLAATFGIADFDWSRSKQLWANTSPMTCEANLVAQAEAVKAISLNTQVFVYRNFVKALPYFTFVREKIQDHAYSGWFSTFNGSGTYNVPLCDDSWNPLRCSRNLRFNSIYSNHYRSASNHCCLPTCVLMCEFLGFRIL